MGLLEKIFPKKALEKDQQKLHEQYGTMTAYAPIFRNFNGSIYETEITRSAIHAVAKHCAKLNPEVRGSAKPYLQKILSNKPNPFQNSYQFLYRIATILKVQTYCFIIPLEDELGRITGYYPLLPQNVELLKYNNEAWLRYTFANGQKAAIEYEKVGVMTEFQYKNDIVGDGNIPLRETLALLDLQNQGIAEGIKQGATIRFMASLDQTLRPEDLETERKNFSMRNLSSDNNTGVMMYDAKYKEVKQIESKPFIIDKDNMEYIKNNIYSYIGVNEDILQNKFNEDTWNAFYEGEIETFAIQLSLVLTNMTYSSHELSTNNEIYYSANKLQYASNKSKLEISTQLFDRGIYSINDINEIWGKPKAKDGDKRYIRKEYAEISKLGQEEVTQEEIIVKEESDDNQE